MSMVMAKHGAGIQYSRVLVSSTTRWMFERGRQDALEKALVARSSSSGSTPQSTSFNPAQIGGIFGGALGTVILLGVLFCCCIARRQRFFPTRPPAIHTSLPQSPRKPGPSPPPSKQPVLPVAPASAHIRPPPTLKHNVPPVPAVQISPGRRPPAMKVSNPYSHPPLPNATIQPLPPIEVIHQRYVTGTPIPFSRPDLLPVGVANLLYTVDSGTQKKRYTAVRRRQRQSIQLAHRRGRWRRSRGYQSDPITDYSSDDESSIIVAAPEPVLQLVDRNQPTRLHRLYARQASRPDSLRIWYTKPLPLMTPMSFLADIQGRCPITAPLQCHCAHGLPGSLGLLSS